MKKITLSLFLFLFLATIGNAQGNAFNKTDNVGSLGLGFGFAPYGTSTIPPISLQYEVGYNDKISIGGIFGYAGSEEDLGTFYGATYKWKYSYVILGARGNYHFLENNDKMDAYGGLTLGYNIASASSEVTGTSSIPYTPASASAGGFILGLDLGGRYYFNPQWAGFAELGFGVGYFTIGVAHKF